MKKLAVLFYLVLTVDAFACLKPVQDFYFAEMSARRHEQIHVHANAKELAAEEVYSLYGTRFQYDFNVLIFEGNSEFMSGFGVEAIVVRPESCEIVDFVQVYAE